MGRHRKLSFLFHSRYGENMNKGFTLTLSMVIVLIFMTTILTIETQKISIEEETHSQHAKLRAINSILLDLNSPAFDYSLSRMGKRAMFNVINEQIASRINDGPTYDYVKDAPEAICEEFKDNFAQYLKLSLGTRLNDIGLSIKNENIQCEVELIDSFTVNLTTSADLIFIEENKIEIKKSISLNSNFSIEGLPDPMLAIESWNDEDVELSTPILRPILLSSLYNDTDENFDEEGNLLISSENLHYSKGWISGELITYNEDKIENEDYKKEVRGKILLINSKSNIDTTLIDFVNDNGIRGIAIDSSVSIKTEQIKNEVLGGCTLNYTLESLQEKQPCIKCGTFYKVTNIKSTCTTITCSTFSGKYGVCEQDKNTYYFYSSSPSDVSYSGIYAAGNSFSNGDYVLINEEDSEIPLLTKGKVYDLERQRIATLCGNYFLSDSAPNIFSRMEGNLYADDEFGIETFILGTWVLNEEYSKLDHEYYTKKDGVKVKGMLGCKDEDMCNEDIFVIGRFAISGDNLEKYGMEDIKYE